MHARPLFSKACGITPVLEETGAELADFSTPLAFEAPDNQVAKRLTLARAVADADVIVTLPILTTKGTLRYKSNCF